MALTKLNRVPGVDLGKQWEKEKVDDCCDHAHELLGEIWTSSYITITNQYNQRTVLHTKSTQAEEKTGNTDLAGLSLGG